MADIWYCRQCGQEVVSKDRPAPMRWTDGHVCQFHANAFDFDKMKALIAKDAFLQSVNRKLKGEAEPKAQLIFNTYVMGDSVMERKYFDFK